VALLKNGQNELDYQQYIFHFYQPQIGIDSVSYLKGQLFNLDMVLSTAIFAMGCFWCGEEAMEAIHGVTAVDSGYCGGDQPNPTYRQVVNTDTGHFEAVLVTFDNTVVSYDTILDHFWHNVDPTDANGQFCDKSKSYLSVIFCLPQQCESAKESKTLMVERFDVVATELREITGTDDSIADTFYMAEAYHQDYYIKNPSAYKYYKERCGRVQRLKAVWGEEEYHRTHANSTMSSVQGADPYLWLKITLPIVGVVLCLYLLFLVKRRQTK